MKKFFLLSVAILLGLNAARAQQPNTSSEDCLKNISLYSDYVKQNNLKEALPFWRNAFCCCPDEVRTKYPSSNTNLYVNGIRIAKYLVDNATDEALKEKYVDTLLWLHDQRAALSPAQKKAALWRKAVDYAKYRPQEVQQIYDLCREAVQLQQNASESSIIVLYMQQANLLYTESKIKAEEVLNLYGELTKILDTQKANGKDVAQVRENIDELFLRSGVASCENLVALYAPKFAETPNDAEFLQKLVNVLSANMCTTEKIYFEASEALYKVSPSADAAVKLAGVFKQQGDYAKVKDYYQKAVEMEADNAAKSKLYVELGNTLNRDMSSPKEARDMAKKALELDPKNGYAYFLLGEIYAGEKNCGSNDFEKRTVYWVAVDCYEKAKQVDPSLTETADKYIVVYKQY
ncbi:MAG: tetratricopeptide repeat protein, partial [Prevotellaceae bacterium]|nr:tetratricopeptide repeat protein [Prevotellaceae bacterium]